VTTSVFANLHGNHLSVKQKQGLTCVLVIQNVNLVFATDMGVALETTFVIVDWIMKTLTIVKIHKDVMVMGGAKKRDHTDVMAVVVVMNNAIGSMVTHIGWGPNVKTELLALE